MIADLVFHHKRRDAEFTGKFVDVVGIYHLTAVQPLLQTYRWCQEFGGEGTIPLLPLRVSLSEQRIGAR